MSQRHGGSQESYVTAPMAQWAAQLEYDQLSPEAVHDAKRFLLDSLGCAVGGAQQHDMAMALRPLSGEASRWIQSVRRWPTRC